MSTNGRWLNSMVVLTLCAGFHGTMKAADSLKTITPVDCSAARLGVEIPIASIGEPVAGVRLSSPVWNEATGDVPANCSIDGVMLPVSKGPHAQPIHFRVMLPATWQRIAIQFGGGGMNGVLPRLAGNPAGGLTNALADGAVTYGSDSGHTMSDSTWALDDEAIRNLSYMQMKKTHDAAMVLIRRMYGSAPRYSYYIGNSQGGREGLTVAQRYPADYDGISAAVPIVNFSALMLGPVLIRIEEKPLKNWVPPVKGRAIAAEFMKRCDGLDRLEDGIINNYQACRAIFDRTGNPGGQNPWADKLCPGDVNPNPKDDSEKACLTVAQSNTLEFIFSRYPFPDPHANGVTSFGMWTPTTAVAPGGGPGMGGAPGRPPGPPPAAAGPSAGAAGPPSAGRPPVGAGGGLLVGQRYKGQEGAAADAPMFTHLGILGSIGFVQQDLNANALDYVEGGQYEARRLEISQWMDATNPDLSAFHKRGGKLLMIIGTNDTVASPGAQLDYYQSLLDKMGRPTIDNFARMWVLPQASHGLEGRAYETNGNGEKAPAHELPNQFDRVAALRQWVEKGLAPPKEELVTGKDSSLPLCSYPEYPRYISGDPHQSTSYKCATK